MELYLRRRMSTVRVRQMFQGRDRAWISLWIQVRLNQRSEIVSSQVFQIQDSQVVFLSKQDSSDNQTLGMDSNTPFSGTKSLNRREDRIKRRSWSNSQKRSSLSSVTVRQRILMRKVSCRTKRNQQLTSPLNLMVHQEIWIRMILRWRKFSNPNTLAAPRGRPPTLLDRSKSHRQHLIISTVNYSRRPHQRQRNWSSPSSKRMMWSSWIRIAHYSNLNGWNPQFWHSVE